MMIKFRGIAEYVMSSPLPAALKENIPHIIDKLNSDILRKGAKNPQDAAKIVAYKIKDNILEFTIESGAVVRLHHATLRIKNFLAPLLGKDYRIGIRTIKIRNPEILIDQKLRFSTSLPLIREIIVTDNSTIIKLNDLDESIIKRPIIDRLLKLIETKEKKAKWGGKVEHWRLIKRSKEKEPKFFEDPNEIIEKIGWIKRFAPGQWLYTPPITHLIRRFEQLFINIVLKPLGFVEVIFPKIVPLRIGVKTGHLKGTPHQMMFASQPLSYNIEDFDEWIDLVSVTEEAPPEELKRFLKDPSYFLCFAQCEPFYWFFEGEIIDREKLPMRWYDKSGPSFRWESGGLRGLERLVEFHRIEITWIGEPDQVIEIRNQLLERYEYFMDKVLDLEWRWAWVTPFYLVHAGEIEEEEAEIDINRPGTIDFEAWLPYKGPKEDHHTWLEIGNISIHGAKYAEPFRIKHQLRDKIIWTGCSGFGVERWFIAFLAQKGFDPDNWPKIVRERITRPPLSVQLVTYPHTKEGKEILDEIEKLLDKLPVE